jgi:hypothetical protein
MYSVAAAAAVTGLNKTTVLQAIQTGRISGSKTELGEWLVDPAELHRLYAPLAGSVATGSATGDAPPAGGELRPRTVLAEQRWLDDMAYKRLARLATSDQQAQQAARTRWWRRVTGV